MKNIFYRKMEFAGSMAWHSIFAPHLPYKAIILVTWRCQSRCRMCNIWKREPQNEFSIDEWRIFFQRNSHLQWLTLSGGEPFLRTDIDQIVRLALESCPTLYYLNMPTNALAPELVKRAVEKILTLGIPNFVLSISLDGPEEIHDRIRGIPGAWQRAMDLLKWAKAREKEPHSRFFVVIEHTLLPDSYGRFDEMVRQVQRYVPAVTAVDFAVALVNVSRHYYGNAGNEDLSGKEGNSQALEQAVRHIINIRGNDASLRLLHLFPRFFLKEAIQYIRTGTPPFPCRAARSSVFIDPCGFVYPCINYTRPLGSLRASNYSIKEVFSRNDMAQIRRDIDAYKCGGCWTPCEASLSFVEGLINPLKIWRILNSAR